MDTLTQTPPPTDRLDTMADDELKSLITHARDILKARENERRKSALEEMRRLAKEHGLTFSAKKKPARKRGRPKKEER